MSRTLPARPNLEHLKKQAKELLAAHRRSESEAVATVAPYFAAGERVGLAQAQLALAREYGFDSWKALSRHVEGLGGSPAEFVEEALAGHVEQAKKLWADHKSSLRRDPAAALVAGDKDAVEAAVKADPDLLKRPFGPKNRPILCYVCFSHLAKDPAFEAGIVATVRYLLAAGADPNAWYTSDWPGHQTPLYGAAGVVNHAGITKMLLDGGADPNDGEAEGEMGESVYHACDHTGHNECLRLILAAGPIQKAKDFCIKRKLDFEDIEGMLVFIEYGCNPNVTNPRTALSHAILRGRSLELIRRLIEAGADPRVKDQDGTSPYVTARRLGRRDIADLLAEKGASTESTPRDDILIAAIDNDVERMKRIAREHPEVFETSHHGRQNEDGLPLGSSGDAMNDLARLGRTKGLETMLDLGVDVGIRNGWSETPLHWACVAGHVETVTMLLARGAPLDVEDIHNHGTPFGWCCWSSQNWQHPGADYVGCVRALLAAGGVYGGTSGSPEVRKVLDEAKTATPVR
jgi:ankyrin repeat protein